MGGCTSKDDKTVAENEGCVRFFSIIIIEFLLFLLFVRSLRLGKITP